MKRVALLIAAAALGARAAEPVAVVDGPRGQVSISLFSGEGQDVPVARVEDQVITFAQFSEALAAAHAAHASSDKAGTTDFRPILDRLIGARLIALEAHEMGLDDSKAFQKAVDDFAVVELRREMLRELLRDAHPDKARVELYFREAVREWKLDSLLFKTEDGAKAFSSAVRRGQDFAALAPKTGAVRTESGYLAAGKMLPQVAAAARELFAGQASDPVQVEGGFAVFKVLDIRYPDNPAARAEAEERASTEARQSAMNAIYPRLLARHARVNRKLLARLDFEAKKPGFSALSKDGRVLARINPGKDVTVADVSREIARGFFHGMDDAIRQKRVNEVKDRAFENLLRGAVLAAEANARNLEATPSFRAAVAEKREGLLFDEFVRRVIVPGLEVKDDESRAYYDSHKASLALPGFYTLDDLAFASAAAAGSAAARLRAGTDFKWLAANAEGKPSSSIGATVSESSLPEEARAAFGKAKPGDVQTFESDGQHHVSIVRHISASAVRPYPEVREEIARKLSGEKINRALSEWVEKLHERHQVEIYLRRIGS